MKKNWNFISVFIMMGTCLMFPQYASATTLDNEMVQSYDKVDYGGVSAMLTIGVAVASYAVALKKERLAGLRNETFADKNWFKSILSKCNYAAHDSKWKDRPAWQA